MIKLFVHVIEQLHDDNIKINIFVPSHHTHIIMDDSGEFIYSGSVDSVTARIKWLENMPHKCYKLNDSEEHY